MYDLRESYVTPNINQAGGVIGQLNISWRNLIEAGIIAFILFSIYRLTVAPILPLTPKIIIGCAIILPPSLIALVGINGVAFSEWVMDIISFRLTRCFVTLKMPMPESGRLPREVKSLISEYSTKDPRVIKQKEREEKEQRRAREKEEKRREKELQKERKKQEKELQRKLPERKKKEK